MVASEKNGTEISVSDAVASANAAASSARNVLTAMLVTAVTMIAIILGTTDEALLRDQVSLLPPLQVTLKLSTAYALIPVVFLFLHANGLLQLHVMLDRLSEVKSRLRTLHLGADRNRWMLQLHGFSYAQYFISEPNAHVTTSESILYIIRKALLYIVCWITVVAIPTFLLLSTQSAFLRYHSAPVTWIHRCAVVFDLILLIWFHLECHRHNFMPRPWREATHILTGIGAVVVVWLSMIHITLPNPQNDNPWTVREGYEWGSEDPFSDGLAILSGEINMLDALSCSSARVFCRYLDLSNGVYLSEKASPSQLDSLALPPDTLRRTTKAMLALDLRNRNLDFADLTESYLLAADLRGSSLRGANLDRADLTGARLSSANLAGVDLSRVASHIDRDLSNADMTATDLSGADLRGGDFTGADLSRANFNGADLRGASFGGTNADGASFLDARLQEIDGGYPYGFMGAASFRGASLDRAQLDGALLFGVDLDGASLEGTSLDGALLSYSDLRSATGRLDSCQHLISIENTLGVWPMREALEWVSDLAYDEAASLQDEEQLHRWAQDHADRDTNITCNGKPVDELAMPEDDWVRVRTSMACQGTHSAALAIQIATQSRGFGPDALGKDSHDVSVSLASALLQATKLGASCPGLSNLSDEDRTALEEVVETAP